MDVNELKEFEARVEKQLKARAALVGGTDWGVAEGNPRIYLQSRRDAKVFFEFPDYPTGDQGDLLGGCALRVLIDECGQHPNWYRGQRAKMMEAHRREFIALCALHAGDEALARDLMDDEHCDDEITDEMMDEAGGHLVNGRLAEARAVLIQAE